MRRRKNLSCTGSDRKWIKAPPGLIFFVSALIMHFVVNKKTGQLTSAREYWRFFSLVGMFSSPCQLSANPLGKGNFGRPSALMFLDGLHLSRLASKKIESVTVVRRL
jgi:hypothetical protein